MGSVRPIPGGKGTKAERGRTKIAIRRRWNSPFLTGRRGADSHSAGKRARGPTPPATSRPKLSPLRRDSLGFSLYRHPGIYIGPGRPISIDARVKTAAAARPLIKGERTSGDRDPRPASARLERIETTETKVYSGVSSSSRCVLRRIVFLPIFVDRSIRRSKSEGETREERETGVRFDRAFFGLGIRIGTRRVKRPSPFRVGLSSLESPLGASFPRKLVESKRGSVEKFETLVSTELSRSLLAHRYHWRRLNSRPCEF